jgi:molybdopterin/thiamine biosynthesis adenylyltransferase/rhodanese-related sulfurtransferase
MSPSAIETERPSEIDVDEVAARLRQQPGLAIIDVREPYEHASGCLPGAKLVPRLTLEERIEALVTDRSSHIVVYCESGVRSALAARQLLARGYPNVHSMRGGIAEWRRRGIACETPAAESTGVSLSAGQLARYARHLRLPEIGSEGQRKLLNARVLCVGAGGLGSPASLYLAAAGIGNLGIVDDDIVDLSNLQRQIIHTTARVGAKKVDSAEQTLNSLNPDTQVTKIAARLNAANVLSVLAGYDLIVDGSDNFNTRYLINDAALRLGKPVIHGAVQRFEGQLTMFACNGAPCYRCVFPQPPPAGAAPSCAEAGVLGVLPGVIGLLQATETIKWLLGIGDSLIGRLIVYDALSMRFTELKLRADPHCSACSLG